MAGAMRKMAVYLGLVEDELDLDPYEGNSGGYPPAGDSRQSVPASEPRPVRPEVAVRPPAAPAERPAPAMAVTSPVAVAQNHRIATIGPRSYNEARSVGEEFRQGVPVIIDLTGMDDSDAKRIVDFSAGLVFGLHGTIQRMSSKVFLLSPQGADVGEQARAQITQDGYYAHP